MSYTPQSGNDKGNKVFYTDVNGATSKTDNPYILYAKNFNFSNIPVGGGYKIYISLDYPNTNAKTITLKIGTTTIAVEGVSTAGAGTGGYLSAEVVKTSDTSCFVRGFADNHAGDKPVGTALSGQATNVFFSKTTPVILETVATTADGDVILQFVLIEELSNGTI